MFVTAGVFNFSQQVVIKNEFITIAHQQIRSRTLYADTDHHFVVFSEFAHQRREIGILADDDKGVDVFSGAAMFIVFDDENLPSLSAFWRVFGW